MLHIPALLPQDSLLFFAIEKIQTISRSFRQSPQIEAPVCLKEHTSCENKLHIFIEMDIYMIIYMLMLEEWKKRRMLGHEKLANNASRKSINKAYESIFYWQAWVIVY